MREAVGLIDQTAFAKVEIAGPDAATAVAWLFCSTPPVENDRVRYAVACTPTGGMLGDYTVLRTGPSAFYVVGAAASRTRDVTWFRRNLRGLNVEVRDFTEDRGILSVQGPLSRQVLLAVLPAEASRAVAALPFSGVARGVALTPALHPVDVLRLTFVGELGYEIHARAVDLPGIHEAVTRAVEGLTGEAAVPSGPWCPPHARDLRNTSMVPCGVRSEGRRFVCSAI